MVYTAKKWNEVVHIVSGKNQKSVANSDGAYPIYGSGGIMGRADDYLCEGGTTVIGRKGTINQPIFVSERFWNVDTAFGIVPRHELLPKFLYYFCCFFNFKALDKSTTIPSLAKRDLLSIEMPIPSIPEQAHIVARIEELFSEMDKAAETLNTTKQQLAVYRQAVLKEAFGTYPHESMTLEDFIEKPRYGTSKKCSAHCPDNGIPVFRIPNVNYRAGKIDQTDLKYAAFPKDEKASLSLLDGDILMIRSNGSVGLVGRVALIRKDDIEGVYAGYLIRLRVKDESVLIPKYLLYWLSASNARNYIERIAKSTSGVNNINAGEIEQIPIQICALEHQEKVIEQIESHLSVCDSIEQTIAAALQQAEAMRQSILKQAFEGRL